MIAIGRRVYGLGAVVLGAAGLAYGAFAPVWLPVPAHLPGYPVLAYAAAALLVLAGLAINAPRVAGPAALALAALFGGSMLATYAPYMLAKPGNWGVWQGVAESTAMALGGVLAWAMAPGAGERAAVARIARLAFGLCLLVFGASHFVYLKLTASMVPVWLPPSQVFWAGATGVAQIAAGLAMLSGVQARLAAILLTGMYLAFGVLVHIPSVLADAHSQDNWAENGINLVLAGAAWSLADWLSKPRRPAPEGSASAPAG